MKSIRYACFIALLVPIQWGFISVDSLRDEVDEANHLFEEGRFQDAIQRYEDIASEWAPSAKELRFNMANAWYREGDYARAIQEYRQALGGPNPLLDAKAYYGMGNAWFQQQNYREAIDNYIASLKLNPLDEDAKYNLELARLLLEEEQQQQEQDQEQDEQEEQDEQDQEQEPSPEGDEQQDQENQQEQQDQQDQEQNGDQDSEPDESTQDEPNEEPDEPSEPDESEQPEQPYPDELTLEEALQLLESFADSERDRRRVIQRQTGPRRPVDQDW